MNKYILKPMSMKDYKEGYEFNSEELHRIKSKEKVGFTVHIGESTHTYTLHRKQPMVITAYDYDENKLSTVGFFLDDHSDFNVYDTTMKMFRTNEYKKIKNALVYYNDTYLKENVLRKFLDKCKKNDIDHDIIITLEKFLEFGNLANVSVDIRPLEVNIRREIAFSDDENGERRDTTKFTIDGRLWYTNRDDKDFEVYTLSQAVRYNDGTDMVGDFKVYNVAVKPYIVEDYEEFTKDMKNVQDKASELLKQMFVNEYCMSDMYRDLVCDTEKNFIKQFVFCPFIDLFNSLPQDNNCIIIKNSDFTKN